MINVFSKTKNISKISKSYFSQYENIKTALIAYYEKKQHLTDKHAKRLFGNVKSVLETGLNDGIQDLKGDFTKIFEDEFVYLRLKNESELIKWLKAENKNPVPKFVSDEFIDNNFEFLSKHTKLDFLTEDKLNEIDLHPIIKEVENCQVVRNKYFKQIDILNAMGNTKLRPILEKSNDKCLNFVENKEEYVKIFLEEFNHFIHQHLVFKTYDIEIDFLDQNFDNESLKEALLFFNIILFLIEEKVIGIYQPKKVFAKKEIFNNFNFNKDKWLPLFKQFGLQIV